jgi:hypothetical protein
MCQYIHGHESIYQLGKHFDDFFQSDLLKVSIFHRFKSNIRHLYYCFHRIRMLLVKVYTYFVKISLFVVRNSETAPHYVYKPLRHLTDLSDTMT